LNNSILRENGPLTILSKIDSGLRHPSAALNTHPLHTSFAQKIVSDAVLPAVDECAQLPLKLLCLSGIQIALEDAVLDTLPIVLELIAYFISAPVVANVVAHGDKHNQTPLSRQEFFPNLTTTLLSKSECLIDLAIVIGME